jgi:ABC-type sugar transport system substrate-binding protein
MQGINNVLEKHPEMKVVSNQAADWDATKAKNIAATVIQQNPDLCAIAGFWDVMDVGTAAAIKESGRNVYLLTQGGGNQSACDGLANGTYSEVVVYNVPGQARDMADMIKQLLQLKQKPGSTKTTLFTPLEFLTKDNMKPGSCWSLAPKG